LVVLQSYPGWETHCAYAIQLEIARRGFESQAGICTVGLTDAASDARSGSFRWVGRD